MKQESKIYIAGHSGLVGSSLMRILREYGYHNLLTCVHGELDLRRQNQVEDFFASQKPEYVFLAAARVGGILANITSPADFLYDNGMIAFNVLHAARIYGAKKVLFLGSSCIYPRDCSQPITEDQLLTGPLEKTNEAYALAKIAGLKLCQAFHQQFKDLPTQYLAVMPTNLYGIGDTFHELNSHVIPALILKCMNAIDTKQNVVTVWGSGKPRREFLYVDDLADGLIMLMQRRDDSALINIGAGVDYSIEEIVQMIAEETGFAGDIQFDKNYPDGTPRKLLDVSRMMEYNWQPKVSLREGIRRTIAWYRDQRRVV